ncbi:hypothetical protein cypCar_00033208 [Cyprinus carpio]|nr:hypothetical protein cypCar_00033208 [Cyprinus carpio]
MIRAGRKKTDEDIFLFSFQDKIPVRIKINSGHHARLDDAGGPNFGQQLYFCYKNQPVVLNQGGNAFNVNTATMYGNDAQLTECEVYKVEQSSQVSTEEKPWRNVLWTAEYVSTQVLVLFANCNLIYSYRNVICVVDEEQSSWK